MSEHSEHKTSRAKAVRSRAEPQRGAILVGVLWVMVFIAFLAVVLRLHMTSVVTNVRVTEDKAAARLLADSGLAYAAALVRAGGADGSGRLTETLTGVLETSSGTVSVTLDNEVMRIDLNTAVRPLLVGMFEVAGARDSDAGKLADEIIKRRGGESGPPREGETPAPPGPPGTPGPPGQGRAAFRSVDELALLPNMEEDVAVEVARYATVSSGLPGMRVTSAAIELLEDIPGLPRSAVDAIKKYRAGKLDGTELNQYLAGIDYHTNELTQSWRATLRVELPSGHAETYEAIIVVSTEDEEAFRVLDWRRVTDEVE